MDQSIRKVSVQNATSRYDVLIGSGYLSSAVNRIAEPQIDAYAFIVNGRVFDLHRNYIDEFRGSFDKSELFIIEDGEINKNYSYAEGVFNWLLKKGFSRRSLVIAIGGGVTGDFAGFIASLFMRGLSIVHVPTTLLAMVDSSIGGKVAVNISGGKNIVGAFHQPKMVLDDIHFLDTLPINEFKNGLTEVVKHAFLGEEGLLALLREEDTESISRSNIVEEMVYRSCIFKSDVVKEDEKEKGLRAILNFGHTVGHAIESLMEYKGISHGEAVALGMVAESELSRRMGLLSNRENEDIRALLDKYQLLENGFSYDAGEILHHMQFDKKKVGGEVRCVLLEGIGRPVYDQKIDDSIVMDVLNEMKCR